MEKQYFRELIFGESFGLLKKNGDEWEGVSMPKYTAFRMVAYGMAAFSTYEHTYKLNEIYNKLDAGTYRILTSFVEKAKKEIPYFVYTDITLLEDFEKPTLEAEAHFLKIADGNGLIDFPEYLEDGNVLVNFPDDLYEESDSFQGIEVIDTVQALQERFGSAYSQKWSEQQQKWIESDDFSDWISNYNEQFFQDNMLITFKFEESAASKYTIAGVTYYKGKY